MAKHTSLLAICCGLLLFAIPLLTDPSTSGTGTVVLPCRMPQDGYLITPDHVGLFVPAGTPITFFPNVNNGRDGQLLAMFYQNQVYRAQMTGNGTFLGYRSDEGNLYQAPTNTQQPRRYYLGVVENYRDHCTCILFPYTGTFTATKDGTAQEHFNAPDHYPAYFPPAPGTHESPEHIVVQPAARRFCPMKVTDRTGFLASVPGRGEQAIRLLSGLPEFLANNNYQGQYFLHDPLRNTLLIYQAGKSPMVISPERTAALLRDYRAGRLSSGFGFTVLVQLPASAGDDIFVDVQISDDFLTPRPAYLTLPNTVSYSTEAVRQLLQTRIKEKIAALQQITAPALQSYQQPTWSDDGELRIREANIFQWIGFTLNEVHYLIKNAKLRDALWNDKEAAYLHKLINIYAPLAGTVDGILLEIRDLYELTNLLTQLCDDPKKIANGIYQFVTQLDGGQIKKMVTEGVAKEIDALLTPGRERQYKLATYTIQATFLIFAWTKTGMKLIFEFSKDIGKKADDFVKFVKQFGDDFGKALQQLDPKRKASFLEDFKGLSQAEVRVLDGKPGCISSWKIIFDDDVLRVNLNHLSHIDDHLGKGIHLEAEMEAAFKAASDKGKWVDDIGRNVLRKANNKAEYVNPSNNVLKWTDQHPSSIHQSIRHALGASPTSGKFYEGKVADYMQQQGRTVDGFGLLINNSSSRKIAGDIDVMDASNIVEVKKSYVAWTNKPDQMDKFIDPSLPNYLNPYKKKVILYIDEALTTTQKVSILRVIPENVTLVNSLNELGQTLQ